MLLRGLHMVNCQVSDPLMKASDRLVGPRKVRQCLTSADANIEVMM